MIGMTTCDIPLSFDIGPRLNFVFDELDLRDAHPNSVQMELTGQARTAAERCKACSTAAGAFWSQSWTGWT